MRQLGAILRSRAGLRLLVLCALFFAAYASPALAADFTVTYDGGQWSTGSLRRRSSTRTRRAGADTISFNIGPAIGVYTIAVAAELPAITDPVTIDGTTQPATRRRPVVEIDGNALGSDLAGLTLGTGSDGSTIRGLIIRRFHGDTDGGIGIEIRAAATRSSATTSGPTRRASRPAPNGTGIRVSGGTQNLIGGTGLEQNVISANLLDGVEVRVGADLTTTSGNLIGVGSDGLARWATAAPGSRSRAAGAPSRTTPSRTTPVRGVLISDGLGTTISANSIHDNTGLGIDLAPAGVTGPTANDPGDADTGPNDLQNFPLITDVSPNSVAGTLDSNSNTTGHVEVFTSPSCDASGYGEGQTSLGTHDRDRRRRRQAGPWGSRRLP